MSGTSAARLILAGVDPDELGSAQHEMVADRSLDRARVLENERDGAERTTPRPIVGWRASGGEVVGCVAAPRNRRVVLTSTATRIQAGGDPRLLAPPLVSQMSEMLHRLGLDGGYQPVVGHLGPGPTTTRRGPFGRLVLCQLLVCRVSGCLDLFISGLDEHAPRASRSWLRWRSGSRRGCRDQPSIRDAQVRRAVDPEQRVDHAVGPDAHLAGPTGWKNVCAVRAT